jgi:AcrR family transcriptional regulator
MARRNLRNLDERILKRTIHYGAVDGAGNISTKRIAKDLRVTEPTIYVHFKTKENLLLSAFNYCIQDLYDLDYIKKAGEVQNPDHLDEELLRLLQKGKENDEEIVYAFNYRHSTFYAPTNSEEGKAYMDLFKKIIRSYVNDPDMTEKTTTTLVGVCLEIVDLFIYKAAKGEIEPNAVNAKILSALVLGGLAGGQKYFYDSLTDAEKASL